MSDSMPDDPSLSWNSGTPWSEIDDNDLAWCINDRQSLKRDRRFPRPDAGGGSGADRSARATETRHALMAGTEDDLTPEEGAAVIAALRRAIDNDRYPRSPRLASLRAALVKLDPG